MKLNEKIMYPVFFKCCMYTTDVFWENVFKNLAYAKTPHGIFISKGFLCSKNKKQEFTYKIDDTKDPKLIYKEIYNLLHKKIGLVSDQQKIINIKNVNDIQQQINLYYSEIQWKSIKHKVIKDLLLELFILKLQAKHKLTLNQTKNLLFKIYTSINFKLINGSDIIIQNGEIVDIKNFDISATNITLHENIGDIVKSNTKNTDNQKKISDNWTKYIKSLN